MHHYVIARTIQRECFCRWNRDRERNYMNNVVKGYLFIPGKHLWELLFVLEGIVSHVVCSLLCFSHIRELLHYLLQDGVSFFEVLKRVSNM